MKSQRNMRTSSIRGMWMVAVLSLVVYYMSNTATEQTQGIPLIQQGRRLFTTSTTRLPMVSTYCTGSTNKISDSDRSTNSGYKSALSSYMKANATRLVVDLANTNFNDLMQEIQINGTGTIIYISPYILGLVLLLLVAPCLCCCCTCTQSCPPKCCRGKNPNYAPSDLTMPTVMLVILCLLIIATALPAMTSSKSFFADFNCQTAKFLDDFYNGNQTANQQYFFSGVTEIRYQLTSVLSPKLNAVDTQITKLKPTAATTMNTLLTDINSVLTGLMNVPKGTDSLEFSQSYNWPLESSSTTSTLTGVVGPSVGTFGVSSTKLGALYSYVSSMHDNITAITTAASNVEPSLNAGDMGAQITVADGVLSTVQSNLDSMKSQVENVLSLLKNIDSWNINYSIPFYGVVLGMACLIIIAIIFLKCLNMLGCRYLIYFVSLILFFFCLLLFVYAVVLALLMPSLFYTCSYFQDTFTSPTSFTSTIITLLGSGQTTLANKFAQCFGGTNKFMTAVNPTLQGYISQLQTAVFNSYQYDFTTMTNTLSTQLNTLQTTINNIGLGHLPDFDTATTNGIVQIDAFNAIANKSLYTSSCVEPSYTSFYQDAWVPGLSSSYQALVGCQDKVGVDNSTCGSDLTNTANCPYSRCIDAFSLISTYYRAGKNTTLVSDANTRYGACANFNSFLTNYYTNYIKPVVDAIGNTVDDATNTSRLAGRFATNAKTPVVNLVTEMNGAVKTLFTQVYSNLTTTDGLLSIFDPSAGVLTGLDCRLLGEDGVNAKEALCITSFNRIYFTIVTVGIMAFASFFVLCFIVCFNVRHYKKSLQRQQYPGRIHPIALDETSSEIQMK